MSFQSAPCLSGLLREGRSGATQILKHFNVSVEQTRREILKKLDPNFLPPEDGQKEKD